MADINQPDCKMGGPHIAASKSKGPQAPNLRPGGDLGPQLAGVPRHH